MRGRDAVINPDFRDLFSALNAAEARYLVVGAYAVTFHSRPRFTKDLDVWIDPEPSNARRAWEGLARFGVPLKDVSAEDLSRPETVLQIGVAPNRIDILSQIEAVRFVDAWPRRATADYGGCSIAILSRADLIANKRAVGRPQDLLDVEALERAGESTER
jgi:hypothetical protein